MEIQEFVSRSHLDVAIVNAWIEEEWLAPLESGSTFQFSDADLARAQLIRDLKLDFGVTTRASPSYCTCSTNSTGCAIWSEIFTRWKFPAGPGVAPDGRRLGFNGIRSGGWR
ncbi:hypothetical protein M2175_003977 [Bradyrhizobium elkanii]|uniref:chaperone modulator CbpM n=1 Tax=Bradyrhizobium TaxID=374 RepID=UPI002168AE60|nr:MULTISPECIES: chaperone modulator CbpM [Bradyrhizobium]MCS3928946.1 hypothetical protein [Bradyrhizobium elkanii]MCS3969502.1 hypothetical protein [Bradyrhizobium japonicum]